MMQNSSLNVNLPQTLEQSAFFTQEPFTIFEIEDFVDDAFYASLVEDVNARQEFDRVFAKKGNKKKFSLGGHNIDDVEQTPFSDFVRFFLSQEFFDWFVDTHLPHFEVRGTPYFVYDKNDPEVTQLRKDNKTSDTPHTFYNTEVHYSSMEQDGFIPPHTDHPRKRLSLVYYLPPEPVSPEMEQNLGTVFYKAKDGKEAWDRFNSGLLNEKQTNKFHRDHEVARVSGFQRNKCAGFIKNDVSWHAVAPNAFDYDRRAIVINVMEME